MKEKNKKKKRVGLYIVGSFAVATGAVVVMPKIIGYLSEKMYTPAEPSSQDDEWGPEIVKKENTEDAAPSEEEETDGNF